MALTYEQAGPSAREQETRSYEWAVSIQAACDTLSRMPVSLMDSITVAGRLEGSRDETRRLHVLSLALAEENGLRAAIETRGEAFSVRFTRPAVH